MQFKKILYLLFLCGLSISALAVDKKNSSVFYPTVMISKLKVSPKLDGKIESREWDQATTITGFSNGGFIGMGKKGFSMVPKIQQVVWHLGFDDKYLYLAMRSPHSKGTYPYARIKENDNFEVLREDHVEIQILPHTQRELAKKAGKGFFKIMVNPLGAFIDQHLLNGTVGTEEVWSTGGVTKCTVSDNYWDLEMSIELARFGIKNVDGKQMVIQLVRASDATGIYFAGLVPASWMEWDRFAEANFNSQSPVFQFLELGEIMAGKLDSKVRIIGKGPSKDIEVVITVGNSEGKIIYTKKQKVRLSDGESKTLTWKENRIPISNASFNNIEKNFFEIKATYKDNNKEFILYHNRSPFVKLTKEYIKKYIKPWLESCQQGGKWNSNVSYLPYSGIIETKVDLDFFGISKKVLSATKVKVNIKQKNKIIGVSEFLLNNKKGKKLLKIGKLPPGTYEANFILFDNMNNKIETQKVKFKSAKYPWINNNLGKSGEVIPPYEPMEVRKNIISTWGANYDIGRNGLPQQIKVRMPSGNSGGIIRKRYHKNYKLLASPIRFEVRKNGQLLKSYNSKGGITKQSLEEVKIQAEESFKDFKLKINASEEYDNWYNIKLDFIPSKKIQIDSLDLIMELKDSVEQPVDTVYIQRERGGRSGNNYYASIDRKVGIKFKSTQLLNLRMRETRKDWKSFVPQAYVGNGDFGLWFLAWSDIGWEIKKGKAVYQIKRLASGNVEVRVRLFSGPIVLSKKRSLEFALQAVPVKPNVARYRTCIGENWVFHDYTGYRFYGRSVDSFDCNSKDRNALRKYLLYGNRYNSKPASWAARHWVKDKKVQDLSRISLYGSTILCGTGAPEFKTFGGEWLKNSNWKPDPKTKFCNRWNYQKTTRWGDSPEQMTVRFINWTESFSDFFVWHYDKLIDECGINGTWWDDQQIMTIHEYDNNTGKIEEKFSTLARRKLCKRLNVVGWKNVRPPAWILNMHSDFSWCQLFWMVESSWYCDGDNITAPMHFSSIGVFRAMARTKSTMMPVQCWLRGYKGTTPAMDRKVKRSLVAMLASHDIFETRMSANTEEGNFQRRMSMFVNFSDTSQCLFTGYWRTSRVVQPSGKDIVASVFANKELKTAAILFYNLKKDKDQYLTNTIIVPSKLLGISDFTKVKRVFDVETGKNINVIFEDSKIKIIDKIPILWHDYRVIGVEVE